MLTVADFVHSHDPHDGSLLDEWHANKHQGPEVLVNGDATGPAVSAIERANVVLEHCDALERRAIEMLESFMKDAGTWSLNTIDCGEEAARMQCHFVLWFTFEATRDPWGHDYTYFCVGFLAHERSHPADRHGRPVKFVVGFH